VVVMVSEPNVEGLVVEFFKKLYEASRGSDGREVLVKEAVRILEDVTKLDKSGRYSILYLLLVNLSDRLPGVSNKDLVDYFLKSYSGLVMSLKKLLRVWLSNQREIIDYLEASGSAEHPLANVFILSEVLGLIDPSDTETLVIRGNIYLNYFKVLREYEEKSGVPLKVQSERAFKNALELFVRAISMDVNCYEGYLGLARLYMLANNLDQAIINYENALRCKRTCEVLKEVAKAYMIKGDNDTASKYLEECKDTNNT